MTKSLTTSDFTKEQKGLIARTIAAGATQDELALFIGQCARTKLDPLSKQIYFIKSGGRVMIQISVDGFRVIAERSKDYAGQDAPVFEEDEDGKISKCTVTVYRWHGDTRYPAAVGVAYWKEYHRPGGNWDKMPHTMIAKVAECIALRKAFPNDLSGLYEPTELPMVELEPEAPSSPDLKVTEAKELMAKDVKPILDKKSIEVVNMIQTKEVEKKVNNILDFYETPSEPKPESAAAKKMREAKKQQMEEGMEGLSDEEYNKQRGSIKLEVTDEDIAGI